jgi:tRNA A37 threonylcarbamoyladenosine biosynthesis protein TsaE
LDDYLENGGVSMVEWPGAARGVLPSATIDINIDLCCDDYDRERQVHISGRKSPIEQLYKMMVEENHVSCEFWP